MVSGFKLIVLMSLEALVLMLRNILRSILPRFSALGLIMNGKASLHL